MANWNKDAESYKRHRERMAERSRSQRSAASSVDVPLEPLDPARREEGSNSLRRFCEIYRPNAFGLGWSPDHLKVLQQIEATVRDGGLFALAMPRGAGKTTITVTAALWALLYGYRHWVCLVGATQPKAEALLVSIKTELRFNPFLLQDFPEVCAPIAALEGRAARAAGQTFQGEPTNIKWTQDQLILPSVAGSLASGAVVSVCGITGDIRGQQFTTTEGHIRRPDYVIADDPQTRESAKSRTQTDDRQAVINGDILGLSGPGIKIAGVVPCTVIQRGDLADRLLDVEQCPEWHGIRTQLLYGFPSNLELWHRYQEIREASFRNGGNGAEATDFYLEHQEDMNQGCQAAWDERYNQDEISAVQNCMNLYFRNPAAFFAEYQNQPLEQSADDSTLTEEQITQRVSQTPRHQLPEHSDLVVAMIDVQQELLFYSVVAWKKDFTGQVIDYGAWPDQKTTNFKLNEARQTLSLQWPGDSLEVRLKKALAALVEQLATRVWVSEDGAELSLRRCLIDANWGQSRNIVYEFCRQSKWRQILHPSHGRYVGASSEPLNAKHVKTLGRQVGQHWRLDRARDTPIRHVLFDANYWKSFLHSRLATEPGTTSSLCLWNAEPRIHATFAKHMKSEYSVRTEGRGRTVDEWKQLPHRPDNHWLDTMVGCCVAGSMEGCQLPGEKMPRQAKAPHRPSQSLEHIEDNPVMASEVEVTRKAARQRGKVSYL